ncbi:MAG TPA: substrate-binding domain-containing protein [Flavisolibacter sp.]|nr:substrate-binding domain-containing protein [Flavisolibacter sp.]
MVSLKDIAQKLGISPTTVSLVLNGKEKTVRISDRLARRIRAVAKQAGYRPNQVAVSLRTGKSKIIGLLVDTISGSLFATMAAVIEEEMEKEGYRIIYCSTGNEVGKGKDLLQILNQHHVDGYLIIPTEDMQSEIDALLEQKKPLVLIDSYFPNTKAPYVLVDNYGGVRQGVRHLIDKGYRKIGFITNDLALIHMQKRQQAFIDMLKPYGGKGQKLILNTSFHDSKIQLQRKISRFLQKEKPEAVFFSTNYLGIEGLAAIKALGWQIPGDIAVVCFDDHELFALHSPPITVVRQPAEQMARSAVRLLVDQIKRQRHKARRQIELPAQMIKRASL